NIRYNLLRLPAPANSFHANTPQSAATMGADCPMAYEMATPVSAAATILKTVPVPQINPPSTPSRCPDAGPRKNPLKLTGSPTSGCFMKYKFQMKQESNAPKVRKTTAL